MLMFNPRKNPDELLRFGFKKEGECKDGNGQVLGATYKYKTHWMKARCIEIIVHQQWSSVLCYPRWGHTEFLIPNIVVQLIQEGLLVANPSDNMDEIYHTLDEYMGLFGEAYNRGELWDFSKEDFQKGAIERREDVDYWFINGRYYEVPKQEDIL